MSAVTSLLTKPIAGMPGGVWVALGGVGVYVALRTARSSESTHTVEEVPVPVGGIASQDSAPLVMSPIVRINLPEIGKLADAVIGNTAAQDANTNALGGNTDALFGNSDALYGNTSALNGNRDALNANTGALNANTGAVNGNTSATAALAGVIGNIASTPAPSAPAPAPAPAARTYVIRSGDTLWGIAARFAGNSARWPELYRANASTIDSVARSRGKAGGGHWIFPGTTLTLPW